MAISKTLQTALNTVFKRIKEREVFETASTTDLKDKLDEAILIAAIGKCVELNVLINNRRLSKENSFLFLANLRGVAEDLIVLQFLAKMPDHHRLEYITLIQSQNLHKGLLTQVRFFEANNPFQAVAGGDASKLEELSTEDRDKLRTFWKTLGEPKRDGPSVRDMAERTGLMQTYEYIYFLSSNFVHFNPHTLMRTGWGPEEGPFRFSVHNFSGYYADLASFYGAVLFVGFFFRLGNGHFSPKCSNDVDRILKIIDAVPRWPEIVTFEEMNRKPPMLGFLARAMRKVAQDDDPNVPYGAILREIRAVPQ